MLRQGPPQRHGPGREPGAQGAWPAGRLSGSPGVGPWRLGRPLVGCLRPSLVFSHLGALSRRRLGDPHPSAGVQASEPRWVSMLLGGVELTGEIAQVLALRRVGSTAIYESAQRCSCRVRTSHPRVHGLWSRCQGPCLQHHESGVTVGLASDRGRFVGRSPQAVRLKRARQQCIARCVATRLVSVSARALLAAAHRPLSHSRR